MGFGSPWGKRLTAKVVAFRPDAGIVPGAQVIARLPLFVADRRAGNHGLLKHGIISRRERGTRTVVRGQRGQGAVAILARAARLSGVNACKSPLALAYFWTDLVGGGT